MTALSSKAPVLNDRWLEVKWVAGKPTPTIGSIRCEAVVETHRDRSALGTKLTVAFDILTTAVSLLRALAMPWPIPNGG